VGEKNNISNSERHRGRDDDDIPDLQAKDELGAFVASHSSVVFPVPEEEEHAFMGLRMYWKGERSSVEEM